MSKNSGGVEGGGGGAAAPTRENTLVRGGVENTLCGPSAPGARVRELIQVKLIHMS